MSISLKCPQCSGEFKGKDKLAGKRVKCPQCGATIQVPAAAGQGSPAAARTEQPAQQPQHKAAPPVPPAPRPPAPKPALKEEIPPLPPTPPAEEPAWSTPKWTDNDDDLPAVIPPGAGTDSVFGEPELASPLRRIVAYVLDILPTLVLMPIVLIPVIGQIFMGVLLLVYWLLRDIRGASLGKWAMGMEVRDVSGGPTSGGSRVLRNLPFGIYPSIMVLIGLASILALIIPPLAIVANVVGMVLVFGVCFVVLITELAMMLITGRRIGDRIAKTIVVKLPAPTA